MPVYLGVKIWKEREQIPGSDIKQLKNGRFVDCKPKYYDPVWKYAGSYPYSTLEEAKQSIDTILARCKEVGGESRLAEFAAIMNSGERLTDAEVREILQRSNHENDPDKPL